MKIEIEKPFAILQKLQEKNEIADTNYRQWLYWNDGELLFPIKSEKMFNEENVYLN